MSRTALFQSTSVISDGRISCMRRDARRGRRSFNPRPSFLTDESRREWMPWWVISSFNPRPSFLTDESEGGAFDARELRGFNPRPSFLTDESSLRKQSCCAVRPFQSTSVISDGRIVTKPFITALYHWFQSTSVISDGRIDLDGPHSHHQARFNPRPSFLTDESRSTSSTPRWPTCFNPRPSFLTDESEPS